MTEGTTSNTSAVRVRDLRKTYGGSEEKVTAVDNVSLDVNRGEITALLGPNGAGKTTIIKSLLGLVEPTSGTVEICGKDVSGDARAAYQNVGVVLEGARNVYWRLTVRENLEYFARIGGKSVPDLHDRHDELLKRFALEAKANEVVRNLSRGMKQKVALIVALARDASVLFLDEPTLGLDIETSLDLQKELCRLTDEDDCGIILTSHDMDVVEAVADRVIVLADGQVVADDTVNSLLDAFHTQAYEVVVDGDLPTHIRDEIGDDYAVRECESLTDRTRLVILFDDGSNLGDLLKRIENAGRDLRSVNTVTPDLAEVFLRVTENKGVNGITR